MKLTMKSKMTALCLALLLGVSACGDERSTAASGALSLMGSMFSNSMGAMSGSGLVSQHLEAQEALKNRFDYQVQALVERQLTTSTDICSSMKSNLEQAFSGATCTVNSCSFSPPTFAMDYSCTGISDSVSCGGTTFELSDFSYESAISVNVTSSTGTMSANMSGNVSGGLSGSVSCEIGITIAESGSGDLDCDDLDNFSCSVGGQALTCAEMQASAAAFSCGQ